MAERTQIQLQVVPHMFFSQGRAGSEIHRRSHTPGNHPAETDCVAVDAVGSEKVSPAALPAICDLQGDFQKLQGERVHCHEI
jgi:hypothetical protein